MTIMTSTPSSTNTLTVKNLTEADAESWDDYVKKSTRGHALHLSGWQQVMKRTYGYNTNYLFASSENQINGVLPMFMLPSVISGKRAMTMPGGLLADDEKTAAALLQKGSALAANAGIDQLVLQDSRQLWSAAPTVNSHHVYWLLDLGDSEENLWKGLDGNIRRQVRIAKRNGLEVQVDRQGDLLGPYYEVFSQFTHQAGTPVFGLDFLENIITVFPDGFNIAVVWHEGQPIAGYFQLQLGDTVFGMWGAALFATLKLRPAYLALWEIMRDAVTNGFKHLDMGRSPLDSNASKFKGQWGGIDHPVYQIILSKDSRSSDTVTDRVKSDDRFQLFMRVWPKLPLRMTRTLGPKLRWHIPFA